MTGPGAGAAAESSPSTRLLAAFCLLAETWLAGDKPDCALHGGRFDLEELGRFRVRPPAVRAALLALAEAKADTEDAVLLDCRLAAVAICADTRAESRADAARRLADRIVFELARPQGWAGACFSQAELDRRESPRGLDVSEPRRIQSASMYSPELDGKGMALRAVTWTQQFRARPEDFDAEAPVPAAFPGRVLSGRAPDIGPGADYETVVGGPA